MERKEACGPRKVRTSEKQLKVAQNKVVVKEQASNKPKVMTTRK